MKFKSITQLELYKYLSVPKANLNKYNCEKKLHLEIIQYLIPLSVDGTLQALWFHPANEAIKSKEHGIGFNILLKMMGKIPGVPDLIFAGKGKMGCIELKYDNAQRGRSAESKLSANQILFAKWCAKFDIPYVIARSWEDVKETLINWDFMHGLPAAKASFVHVRT